MGKCKAKNPRVFMTICPECEKAGLTHVIIKQIETELEDELPDAVECDWCGEIVPRGITVGRIIIDKDGDYSLDDETNLDIPIQFIDTILKKYPLISKLFPLIKRPLTSEQQKALWLEFRQNGWSYRRIAEISGVDVSTVFYAIKDSPVGNPTPKTITGKDGKEYPSSNPKVSTLEKLGSLLLK